MILVYYSNFYANYNYCFLVKGNTTIKNIKRIHIIQKRAIRIICHIAYVSHTKPLFEKFYILQVTNYYSYKLALSYKKSLCHDHLFLSIPHLVQENSLCRYMVSIPLSRTRYSNQMLRSTLPRLLNCCSE